MRAISCADKGRRLGFSDDMILCSEVFDKVALGSGALDVDLGQINAMTTLANPTSRIRPMGRFKNGVDKKSIV